MTGLDERAGWDDGRQELRIAHDDVASDGTGHYAKASVIAIALMTLWVLHAWLPPS